MMYSRLQSRMRPLAGLALLLIVSMPVAMMSTTCARVGSLPESSRSSSEEEHYEVDGLGLHGTREQRRQRTSQPKRVVGFKLWNPSHQATPLRTTAAPPTVCRVLPERNGCGASLRC